MLLIVKLMSQPSHFQDGNVATVSHSHPAGSQAPGTHFGGGHSRGPDGDHPFLSCNLQSKSVSDYFSFIEIVAIK